MGLHAALVEELDPPGQCTQKHLGVLAGYVHDERAIDRVLRHLEQARMADGACLRVQDLGFDLVAHHKASLLRHQVLNGQRGGIGVQHTEAGVGGTHEPALTIGLVAADELSWSMILTVARTGSAPVSAASWTRNRLSDADGAAAGAETMSTGRASATSPSASCAERTHGAAPRHIASKSARIHLDAHLATSC